MFHKLVVFCFCCGFPLLAAAQLEDDGDVTEVVVPTSSTGKAMPIKILADEVEVDPNNNTSVYSGNVELQQGTMTLVADSLTATVRNGQLDRLEARGRPARFNSILADGQPVVGEATHIDFKAAREILILKGDGLLKQAGNSINNDRIEFNLKTGNFNAGGKAATGRVEVILQPASE